MRRAVHGICKFKRGWNGAIACIRQRGHVEGMASGRRRIARQQSSIAALEADCHPLSGLQGSVESLKIMEVNRGEDEAEEFSRGRGEAAAKRDRGRTCLLIVDGFA